MAKDRILNDAQRREFFQILGDPKKLNSHVMCKLFARSKKNNNRPRYSPSDIITIGTTDSRFVKDGTHTSIGIYIINRYLWEDLEIFGYINKVITAKDNGKIQDAMSKAYMEDEITGEQFARFIDRCQYLNGGPLGMIINPSLSQTIITLPKGAQRLRRKLLVDEADGLRANDTQTAVKIEHAVVDEALREMHQTDDPALAYFDSGCGIDAYNQYKTICVMKGAIQDNTGESPTGYKIVTSNYDLGISKEDMPKIADAVVTTAFSSGVSTQDSGTLGKKINTLFQNIRIQDPGSDCGSTEYITPTIDDDNKENYIYRWIVENGKLVLLTHGNIDSYVGKTVKMRTPIHCKAKYPEYCSKCIGDRPYRLGMKNIGFTFMTISGSTLNASLKKKHDVSIKLYDLGVEDVMKYVG